MVARQEIVEHWQRGLTESRLQITDGSARFRWLRCVYVRLYAFLISTYGDAGWRADVANTDSGGADVSRKSRMPFIDHTSTDSGLNPKSSARIRQTLNSVHAANTQQCRGRRVLGVWEREWVTLTSHKNRRRVSALRRMLVQHRFEVRHVRRTTDHSLEVRHLDFDAALDLISQKPPAPTSRDGGRRATVSVRRNHVPSIGLLFLATAGISFIPLLVNEFVTPLPGSIVFYVVLWILSSSIGWCVATQHGRQR